ncbi:MAG: nucleotide exchange factor GrpE [Clostridiales bacterium]|nr:nucleotide exchange factor GrpE [Clostridiales bacterium]
MIVLEKKKDKEVKQEKETIVSKEAEYLDMAQRIKAEFENYKRRNADVVSQSFDNGVAHTVAKMLPAIDSFKQAKSSIQDENMLKGLDLVLSQIITAFGELGVTKIPAVGEQFNPNFHNAVLVGNETDKEDGIILDEYQEGFILKNDRVIRHSVVKINKLDK